MLIKLCLLQGIRIDDSIIYCRCVVLCDGFYEWQSTKGEKDKQPYFIYAPQPEGVRILLSLSMFFCNWNKLQLINSDILFSSDYYMYLA